MMSMCIESIYLTRRRCGLTLSDVAHHIGVSVMTLTRIEQGNATAPAHLLPLLRTADEYTDRVAQAVAEATVQGQQVAIYHNQRIYRLHNPQIEFSKTWWDEVLLRADDRTDCSAVMVWDTEPEGVMTPREICAHLVAA